MAIPIIPILLAATALGSGIVQGISTVKNAKSQAQALQEQTQDKVNERAKAAKKLMQQQKSSFLKSGVYFDSGTPVDVINETYDTSIQDINALAKDSGIKVNNLMRQGKTAFFNSVLQGSANAAMAYFMAGGNMGVKAMGAKEGLKPMAMNDFRSWYQNLSGKYRGGFGQVRTNNFPASGDMYG